MLRRFGPWPVLALALSIATAAPFTAAADSLDAGAETCERAIAAGARRGHVPEGVLHAISLTETGRAQGGRLRPWPWAINREGRGFWFASRDEALGFARQSLAEGRPSFDVGCFQINYQWHGANFASLEAMFDPDAGADYAARFLTELYQARGDWSAAAGAYHSQTPDRASVYRARFDRILAGLGDAPLAVPDAPKASPAVVTPKKSRTRLRGPKIITLAPKTAPEAGGAEAGLAPGLRGAARLPRVAELAL